MSLLDDNPLNWDNSYLRMLRGVLIGAYSTVEAAQELANAAGIEPGTFPFGDNMREIWTALLDEMASQRKLRTLVEKAAHDTTVHGLRAIFEEIVNLPDDPVELGYEKPCQAPFLYQGRPFINREDFRGYLTQMHEPGGNRFLVVNGPPHSGKTYSYYLVETLKKPWEFKCAFIELKEPESATYYADRLATEINSQLQLAHTVPLPDQQSVGDRWAQELRYWLVDKIKKESSSCWIVLDGFGHPDLPPATKQLVDHLIEAVDQQLGDRDTRLLLLDYPATSLPPHLRWPVALVDDLAQDEIGSDDLVSFFWQAFAHKKIDHDESLVMNSAAKVLNNLPADRKERMLEIMRRVMLIMAEIHSLGDG